MAITDWPVEERPREKLLAKGPAALSDAELLAIFLRTGTRGKTAVDLARDLLQRFGSLRRLMSADRKNFCQANGLGEAKFVQLQALMEMTRRHGGEILQAGESLGSPGIAKQYIRRQLLFYPYEVFAVLFLDNRHRVIQFEELFRGTINGASVYPREVVRRALHWNAAAMIIAHNHPSGVAEPSESDLQLTVRLRKALELMDIRVLDHFIVGEQETVSLAERGLM